MVAAGYGSADKVPIAGGTMTGTLTLAASPPLALPSGTAGYLLVSDASGNLTLTPPVSGAPTGSASGDLSGSYPGPTVSGITGVAVTNSATAGSTLVVQSGGTTAHWQAPSSGTPSGPASGDLSGSYPGPTVAGVAGIPITGTAAAGNALIVGSGATSLTWVTPAAGVTLDTTHSPQALGTAASGTGSNGASASDHVHPSTSIINGVTVGGTPASGKVALCTSSSAATWTAMLDSTNGDTKALASSASAGSGTISQAAQADHVHPTTGLALLAGAAFTGAVSTTSTLTVSKRASSGVVTMTDGTSITLDSSLGNTFRVTLTASGHTLANPSNATVDGQMIIVEITQGSGGGLTVSFGSQYLFTTAMPAPTLTSTASYTDVFGFKFRQSSNVWRCMAISQGYSA